MLTNIARVWSCSLVGEGSIGMMAVLGALALTVPELPVEVVALTNVGSRDDTSFSIHRGCSGVKTGAWGHSLSVDWLFSVSIVGSSSG